MSSRALVVGTRGSALARWQSRYVVQRLRQVHPDLRVEELVIRTAGDRTRTPIGEGADRGVFVREIDRALVDGSIDIAVHSMKDLPTTRPDGIVFGAVPGRHDPRDALVTRDGDGLAALPAGARLATGSPRRRCQLLHARADLRVVPVRGNVDTRVRKLEEGQFDGLVLALAGVERLGIASVGRRALPIETCLPAAGQGALAVEARSDDEAVLARLATLDDPTTARAIAAERAFLRRLGGGCLAPAAAFARVERGRLVVRAAVGDPAGRRLLRESAAGAPEAGTDVAEALAERLLAAGADELLAAARAADLPPGPA